MLRGAGAGGRPAGLPGWAALYLATGVLQPLLVDGVRVCGAAGSALAPLLANTLGMAAVGALTTYLVTAAPAPGPQYAALSQSDAAGAAGAGAAASTVARRRRAVLAATAIDLVAGWLCAAALVQVGSGVYTVINSSTTAWTAVISWVLGKPLSTGQWAGIGLVSLGLLVHAVGVVGDSYGADSAAESRALALGIATLLAGTVCHAGAYVFNERTIARHISAFELCGSIGAIESALLVTYVVGGVALRLLGGQTASEALVGGGLLEGELACAGGQIAALYAALVTASALHALAFFSILGRIGAVATGVLKSMLSVSVFGLASSLFCGSGVGSAARNSCITPVKVAAIAVVLLGSLAYRTASAHVEAKYVTS
jgi:hypothetical protein